jgi:hypothetical protein
MSKRSWQICILAGLLILSLALTSSGEEKGAGGFESDFKTSGKFFTQMSGMTMGKSPHGEVQIWYSNNLKDLLAKPTFTAPVGATAIKPFNNDGKKGIDGYAIMVKKAPGFDAKNNDWYYEMRTPAGEVMEKMGKPMAGKMKMCASCHAAASANDYLSGAKNK